MAAESPRRARKLAFSRRLKRKAYQVYNWLPVEDWSRRQAFRSLRAYGIEPHWAYAAQGMTPGQMYDEEVEGGARQACVGCLYVGYAELCHQAQEQVNGPTERGAQAGFRALERRANHASYTTVQGKWKTLSVTSVN